MLFEHFFWDFDGTLFDTYPRVTRAMQKALLDVGLSLPFQEVLNAAKISLSYAAEKYGALAHVSKDAVMERYHVHGEEEGYETMLPYEGAEDFLRAVVQNGGKNYLYTHRGVSSLSALEHYSLDGLFSDAVTSADGFAHKPAPDALNFLCEKHGLSKATCIMLGDRDIDLDAGKNAGMSCALFDPDGFYPHYDAPYKACSFAQLKSLLIL